MEFRRRCGAICSCYSFISILVFISTVFGYRNYIVVLDGFKCTTFNNFAKKISCTIDKSGALAAYLELQKQIDDLRMDTSLNLLQKNKVTKELYNSKGMKACDTLEEHLLNPILRVSKRMCGKFCQFPPKCPVLSGYVFEMANFTFNTENLPDYLPECTFKIRSKMYNGQTQFLVIEATGKVIHKRVKTNGRKTSNKS